MEPTTEIGTVTEFISRSAYAFMAGLDRLEDHQMFDRYAALEQFDELCDDLINPKKTTALVPVPKGHQVVGTSLEPISAGEEGEVLLGDVQTVGLVRGNKPAGVVQTSGQRVMEDRRGYQRWQFNVPATVTIECDVMTDDPDVAKIIINGLMANTGGRDPESWKRTHAHTFPVVVGYSMGGSASNIRRVGKGVADDVFKADQRARDKGLPNGK